VGSIIYLIACLIVAFFGRKRVLRFIGTFIISIVITPILMALILFVTAPRPVVVRRESASG